MSGKKKIDWAVLLPLAGFSIWGFSLLLTRVGQRYAAPMVLLSIRFLLAFALLNVPLLLGRERLHLRGRRLRPLIVLGVLEPLCFVFESYAIYFTNATVTGVVSALSPIVAMALAALLLRERPTRRQALFSLLPVAGVILLTAAGQEAGAVSSWIGIPFLLLYSVCSGYYKVANRAASDFSPYERTYVLLLSCAVCFTAAALVECRGDLSAYAAPLRQPVFLAVIVLLSVFCSIVANMLVNYGAGRISVTKMSAIGNVNMVISAFAGVLFLREPFTWVMLLGALLVLVGVWQVTKQKENEDASALCDR